MKTKNPPDPHQPMGVFSSGIEPRSASRRRTLAMWVAMIFLIAASAEGLAAVFYYQVILKHYRFQIWNPDIDRIRKAWEERKGSGDPEIGWPAPAAAREPPYDATGAKANPDFPDPRKACAAAFGDSFVSGYEVPPAMGWVEQLSRMLGCRISNYAVPGYGVDQAFIRFRRDADEPAPTVLLGIFPQDVMRTVNQYRAFIAFAIDPHGTKGRFILDRSGALEWIPRPRLDLKGFIALNQSPAKIVPGDYLIPGSEYGLIPKHFSYLWTVMALEFARFAHHDPWSDDFLSATHPSGAFRLTIAIVAAFHKLAEQRHKHLLVVMLPGAPSLRHKLKYGGFEYDALKKHIAAEGIDIFDVGPALLASDGAAHSYCDLFRDQKACNGHYSIAGNTAVAKIMAGELTRRGLVPAAHGN